MTQPHETTYLIDGSGYIFRAFYAGPIEDAETDAFSDSDADLDLGSTDAAVDAAVDAASTVDAVVDAVVDATVPPPAPTTEQVVVLPKRNGMRVGWLYDGSLYRTCLPAAPGAAECGASELPGEDPRFVSVGEVQGPLLGVNTTSGSAGALKSPSSRRARFAPAAPLPPCPGSTFILRHLSLRSTCRGQGRARGSVVVAVCGVFGR